MKNEQEKDVTLEAPAKQRKPRRPMTEEEKAARTQLREETRMKAENLKPVIYVQYQESEAEIDALVEAAKAAFHQEKPRTKITDLKLYIKPEERAAYYVINGDITGKVSF